MKSLRFSIVQLLLAVTLVALLLAGYRAFMIEKDFVERFGLGLFPDGEHLLFRIEGVGAEVWDVSGRRPRVSTITTAQMYGRGWDTIDIADSYTVAGNRILSAVKPTTSGLELLLVDGETGELLRRGEPTARFEAVSKDGVFYVRSSSSPQAPADTVLEVVRIDDDQVVSRTTSPEMNGPVNPRLLDVSADGRELMWITRHNALLRATSQDPETLDLQVQQLPPIPCRDQPAGTPASLLECDSGRIAWWDFCRSLLVVRADGQEIFAQKMPERQLGDVDSGGEDLGFDDRFPYLFAISDDGKRLLWYNQRTFFVSDIERQQTIYEAPGKVTETHVTMSLDGRRLYQSSRDRLSVWDLDSGREVAVYSQSNRWRNAVIFWLALSAWAAIWGWQTRRRGVVDADKLWQPLGLAHTVVALAVLIGVIVAAARYTMSLEWWPSYLLAGVIALVALLVELRGWWVGRRRPKGDAVSHADVRGDSLPAPAALRWIWRLMIVGGLLRIAVMLSLLTLFITETNTLKWYFYQYGQWLIWQEPGYYLPIVAMVSSLIGLLGLRLIAAGTGQMTGPELDALRRHQFWSWLCFDPINTTFAVVEWLLSRRADVKLAHR